MFSRWEQKENSQFYSKSVFLLHLCCIMLSFWMDFFLYDCDDYYDCRLRKMVGLERISCSLILKDWHQRLMFLDYWNICLLLICTVLQLHQRYLDLTRRTVITHLAIISIMLIINHETENKPRNISFFKNTVQVFQAAFFI